MRARVGHNAAMTEQHDSSTPQHLEALPSLVAFDLDDTLAPSKTAMPPRMAAALRDLLDQVPVCIISGGQIGQFRDQVLAHLEATGEELGRLHLMPTCGTRYYSYAPTAPAADAPAGQSEPTASGAPAAGVPSPTPGMQGWTLVYANDLTPQQISKGFAVVEREARRLGLWEEDTWGPVLEDRGSQITFSALGQQAPIDAKRAWDPDGTRKAALRDAVAPYLPDLEVRSGGSTSVDITLKGVDKAYGMQRLAQVTGLGLEDMLFIGDRLDPQGNDYPVKALGVPCHEVAGWQETAQYVADLARRLAARGK